MGNEMREILTGRNLRLTPQFRLQTVIVTLFVEGS